jgi:chitodextrinase
MKKLFYFLVAAIAMTAVAACNPPEDEHTNDPAAAPTADFEYAIDGLRVVFTDKCTNAASYKWEFGDGETSKEKSPTHEYASAGEYTVKLTVANIDGATAKKEATLTLAGAAKAYFTAKAQTDRAGHFGLTVDFDATASENAKTIAWNFGDGETGSEFKMSHTYAAYGKYTVKAEVTGLAGDKNTYQAEVDVIAYNELLKGGSMEEDDANYWSFIITDVLDGDYAPMEGVPSWIPTFGFTDDRPSGGKGGCLRLSSDNQIHDQANNIQFYQAIEVVEGDYLELSAQMKWGEGSNDCGLLWFGIAEAEDEVGKDGTSVVEMFNYWNPDWDNMRANSVPALDSGFEASDAYIAANATMGLGYSNGGEPVAHYWAQKTGTVYFYVDYRSVWGTCFGPGNDILFDELSVKVVPAPAE